MSGIVNKIKEVVHGDKHHSGTSSTGHSEGSHGPHDSRAANAADPRVDSDRDGSRTAGGNTYGSSTGTHGSSGLGSSTHGSSGLGSGTHSSGTGYGNTQSSTTDGPHNSNVLNKLDPRVDSDRDGSRTAGGNNTYGSTGTSGFSSGTHAGTHENYGSGSAEGAHGPHSSRLANAADPRVDSDRDGSRTAGGNTYGSSTGGGLTGSHGNTTGYGSGTQEGSHGPHSSRLANAADPRVDSDRDGSRTAGGNTYVSSTGGGLTGSHGGNHGEHTTLGHAGAAVGGVHGTGPAPGTAGPHKSDALNKADPRVDSDLDGSKTVGGNKTYSQS